MILNNQSDPIVQIDVNAAAKTFQVFQYDDYGVRNIRLPLAKKRLVVSIRFWEEGGIYLQGACSLVNLGNISMTIPKTMTLTGPALYGEDPDGEQLEFKGTLTYNSKATVAANLAGNDTDQTVAGMRANLISKGYEEIIP